MSEIPFAFWGNIFIVIAASFDLLTPNKNFENSSKSGLELLSSVKVLADFPKYRDYERYFILAMNINSRFDNFFRSPSEKKSLGPRK